MEIFYGGYSLAVRLPADRYKRRLALPFVRRYGFQNW